MIDFAHIEKYHENNRIEAKRALGGLPHSIWETYSAFANTLGGIILLGVEEHTDGSLHPIDLPDPERLVRDFWDAVNNVKKVNVNILSVNDVTIEDVDGCRIVAIRVPRAERADKPVFVDGNPLSGTYRRNGEGDYHCTKEEVQAMMRDAAVRTQDMLVLDAMDMSILDYDSVRRYRIRMKNYRPGHVWEELDDVDFLYKLGAAGRGEDGQIHPTAAGLLMFGYEYEIVKEFPAYFLDYQERADEDTRWTDRVVSSSGDWSGNVYDFYFRVYNKMTQNLKIPFHLVGGNRMDDTPVRQALREALANCLINADYYGRQGIVIIQGRNVLTFSNPGGFRIDVEAAKSGGVSDPRNSALIKMFNLIAIGERAGSGIPNIYRVWHKQGWRAPTILESFEPDRVTLWLEINDRAAENSAPKSGDGKVAIESGDRKVAIESGDRKVAIESGDRKTALKTAAHKQAIIDYLTEHIVAKSSELAALVGVKSSRIQVILTEMVADGIIVSEGVNRYRVYRLKS